MKKISIPAILAVLCLAGCASQSFEPGKEPAFVVSADFAKFYLVGPGQGRGPDASLRTGEPVKMLRREMGFSFVQLEDGRSGYVANEEISPAPEPVAVPQSKRPRKKNEAGGAVDFPDVAPGRMPDLSELPEAVEVFHPLEELDIPPDAKPQFRY
jgi:hypothetical protein